MHLKTIPVHDFLYVDDALLLDASGERAQQYMDIFIEKGAEYGLQVHWKTVESLAVRCSPSIVNSIGEKVARKGSICI